MASRIQIKVLLGFKCNQKCIYCDNPKNLLADFTRIDELTLFINSLKKSYNIILEVDGGDSFEYPEIVESIIAHNYETYIFTNGTYLNEENIGKLSNKTIIRISLDGVKSIHDAQRLQKDGSSGFEKTILGIELLQKNNIPFIIGSTITSLSIPLLEQSKDFILGLNPERWILTTQMFNDDPNRERTKEIYSRVEPIILGWKQDPRISFHSFHEPSDEKKIEVLFKQQKIQINQVGYSTPILQEYSYNEMYKIILAVDNIMSKGGLTNGKI